MVSEDYEEYEVSRNPKNVLYAIWLLHYYMNRTPGQPRPTLPYYSICMAARILGLHAQKGDKWSLGDYADDRLRLFGLEPLTHEVIDKKRWAIAWKILNRHWDHGCPWRIQSEKFEQEFAKAAAREGDVPEAAPVTYTKLRPKHRPYKEAWDVKKYKPQSRPTTSNRAQTVFNSRVNRYLSELYEQ